MWITNGNLADVAVVWARADDGTIRGFVVPTDVDGFTANPIKHKMSLRASNTSELVLDNVRLPGDAVLPGVASMRGPLSCLSEARFGILWGVMGAARSCYEASLAYAGEREAFGGPISRFQLTQHRLVEMMVKVQKGTLLALHLGRLKDQGLLAPSQVSFGKMDNTRAALEVAREARALHGGNGITLDYVPIRHMLNLETVYTYEGTHEIHQLIMGQAITGHAAYG
jgi:glutaryl-CoA dehydrogenase